MKGMKNSTVSPEMEEMSSGSSGVEDSDEEGQGSEVSKAEAQKTTVAIEMAVTANEEPPHKQARLSKGDLYKAPTNEELNQLKETENLYHSTLFRMQISELLEEVKIKEKRRHTMERAVDSIRQILLSLPEGKEHNLQDQKWLTKMKCQVPFVQQPTEVKGKFHFLPPKNVKVTGSFLLDTCIKPGVHVDIVVEMPKECTQAKDHLNQRYLRKRAVYLAVLASHLHKHDMIGDVKYMYHHGNHMKPILVVEVKGDSSRPVLVHVHVVPEDGSFKLNRFHVCKNNVRQSWFNQTDGEEEIAVEDQTATPVYNCNILQDLTMHKNMECIERLQEDSLGMKEGIALLKVWLRQRELDKGYGSFSGFIISMYVTYLMSKKRLNKMMSSYQVMRNTLLNLSKSDWINDGISLCSDHSDPLCPDIADFHTKFDVVFVDVTGYLNLCASVDSTIFQRVKHEAELAMILLEDRNINSFEMLFMRPVSFLHKFDHVFHITHIEDLEKCVEKLVLQASLLDLGGNFVHAVLSGILSLLQKALGQRVKLVQVQNREPVQWSITEEAPEFGSVPRLTFGILLDSQYSSNVLDKGPAADSPQAKGFRDFWGIKSELRRFQDGSICEAVLWAGKVPLSEKRLICSSVVTYILERHASIPAKHVQYIGGNLDPLLHIPVSLQQTPIPYGTGEEQNVEVLHAYDGLCKILRSLKDLPLTINSIQGTSSCFRYAEVFPPLPATFKYKGQLMEGEGDSDGYYLPTAEKSKPCPVWTPTLDVVCTLEGSGKWPEDLEAMRRLKAAFYIEMSRILENQHNLPNRVTTKHVDVLKDGYVFRILLAYNREIALYKMVRMPNGMVKFKDTDASLALERDTVALPRLTSMLHGLQQQHNTFSSTVRLAKRWVSAHLLSDFVPDMAVELIVAYLFLTPAPFTPTSSSLAGFQRFLNLLSTFDWKTSPLIVNLNQELTKEDIATIGSQFNKERTVLPLMFIATPLDKLSSHWTKKNPTAPVLQRLVLLAQESLKELHNLILSTTGDFKQIFRPPLDIYDVLIHLRPKQIPRHYLAIDITEKTFIPRYGEDEDNRNFPVTDFDPVQCYLRDLRTAFDEFALFFNDRYGGSIIAVLWKPSAFQRQEFKVSHMNGRMLQTTASDKDSLQLVPNIEAILEDFRILGGGIVAGIEPRTDKCKI